jgi:hypothetical protein
MNDDAFARLIAEDVKNTATPSQREYLALESNLHRWKRGLIALVENLNQQIASLDADQQDDMQRYISMGKDGEKLLGQSIEHYTSKIAKIKRFKFHVEKRLNEVNSRLENNGMENASFAEFLKAAILKHKELMLELELDPTEIDEALWAAVDNIWNFDNVLSRIHGGDSLYAS